MKNNIIISGVPRAGKSTISHLISKKFGYQHICMDSINAGFEEVFPELGIDTSADMPSLEKVRNSCVEIVEVSKFVKEQCIKYNLSYYETAKEREAVFEQIIDRFQPK